MNGVEILGKRRNARQWKAWKNQPGVKTLRVSGAETSRRSGVKTSGWYKNWLSIHQADVEHNQAASFLHPLLIAQENHLTTSILFLFAAPNVWPNTFLLLPLFEPDPRIF